MCDNYTHVREKLHDGFNGNLNISICTQVRNECHLVYGWVMFHYLHGVNKFHIYLIEPSDCTEDILSDLVKKNIVVLHHFPQDAFEYESEFKLCEQDRTSPSNIRLYMGKNVCQNYSNFIDECKLSLEEFDTTLDNKHRPSCQYSSMYDCFRRHENHDGLVGMIDVDEYIFSNSSKVSLPEAFSTLPKKDVFVIEGLLYGMTKQYRRQMPFDLLPVLHRWHIELKDRVQEAYKFKNGVKYRNFARKSFYRMPVALQRQKFFIENHEPYYKNLYDSDKIYLTDKENDLVYYNHYMYKSLEEWTFSSILTKRYEREVIPSQLHIFEEQYGSRMETFLNRFQDFFEVCEVPKIKKLLQSKTKANERWWKMTFLQNEVEKQEENLRVDLNLFWIIVAVALSAMVVVTIVFKEKSKYNKVKTIDSSDEEDEPEQLQLLQKKPAV